MPSWPATIDENRVRLRASCNACNESKVRCSQQKPTCARCERNEIECVYGLSRRTHKDAPPISIPSSPRGGMVSRSGRPTRIQLRPNSDTGSSCNSTSKTATPSNDANFFGSYLFSAATGADSPSIHRAAQLSPLDFSSLVTGITDSISSSTSNSTSSTAMVPRPFSATCAEPGAEYANLTPWDSKSLFDANHSSDAISIEICQVPNSKGECTCHAKVTELLALMHSGSSSNNDQQLSLDARLAKLKQCIVSSEISIGYTHGREDSEPIHIMAIAMLISQVIDGFKTLVGESLLHRSSSLSSLAAAAAEMAILGNAERGSKSGVVTPSSTNMSGGLMEPRLSWGVLELEENDEVDLRQMLYLLSFRKLERLLSRLTLYLRDLHNALASLPDPSQHMAFVIACDYTRLWLEKKASDVKRLFSVLTSDETMYPVLVQRE